MCRTDTVHFFPKLSCTYAFCKHDQLPTRVFTRILESQVFWPSFQVDFQGFQPIRRDHRLPNPPKLAQYHPPPPPPPSYSQPPNSNLFFLSTYSDFILTPPSPPPKPPLCRPNFLLFPKRMDRIEGT